MLFRSGVALLSLPLRGAWIEIGSPGRLSQYPPPSLPLLGAWIEISAGSLIMRRVFVAPLAGSVD